MGGLQRLCKIYGSIETVDVNGKKAIWLWDYVNEKARLKSEMTKDEIKASEVAKYKNVKRN